MALIIEDGSIVPNANSYRTVAELRTYADLRGIDLTALSDKECEVLLIKAMDYLESLRDKFKGRVTDSAQPLQWPRADVWDLVYPGALFPSNEIPRELLYAQTALALDARDGDLMPTRRPADKGPVISEKVEGAIEVKYSNPGAVLHVAAFAKADALLAPLLKYNGLTLVRS